MEDLINRIADIDHQIFETEYMIKMAQKVDEPVPEDWVLKLGSLVGNREDVMKMIIEKSFAW